MIKQYCLQLMNGLLVILSVTAYSQNKIKDEATFKINKELGRGVNIPSIQNMDNQHYFTIKQAGFNNVRIPIIHLSRLLIIGYGGFLLNMMLTPLF